VQVYFAGYGWVNFEPSATFATFSRPQPNQFPADNNSLSGVVAGAAGALGAGGKNGNPHPDASDNSSAGTGDATQGAGQIRQQVGFTLVA